MGTTLEFQTRHIPETSFLPLLNSRGGGFRNIIGVLCGDLEFML